MPVDCGPLIGWQFLSSEPVPTQPAEQVGMWARRDKMRLKNGTHPVLDPGAMPNDLVAASHQPAPELGFRIGQLNLR
jgi:hypothetical protein